MCLYLACSWQPCSISQRRLAGPWLHAWHDPVANLSAFSSCVRLADINADGEYKLLVADGDKKLKVYKGWCTHSTPHHPSTPHDTHSTPTLIQVHH